MGAGTGLVPTMTCVMQPQRTWRPGATGQRWQFASLQPPPFGSYPGSSRHLRGSGSESCPASGLAVQGSPGAANGRYRVRAESPLKVS